MTRRHFNQILRIRRAVPPAQVMKIPLRAHVLPETVVFTGSRRTEWGAQELRETRTKR